MKKSKPKSSSLFRPCQLIVRFTPEEIRRVRKAAEKEEQPISWWVRRVLLEAV